MQKWIFTLMDLDYSVLIAGAGGEVQKGSEEGIGGINYDGKK